MLRKKKQINYTMQIEGTIVYKQLSGGFWGIEDTQGNHWRPKSMPKALQQEGLKLKATIKESKSGAISIFMWGTSVDLIKFEIVD